MKSNRGSNIKSPINPVEPLLTALLSVIGNCQTLSRLIKGKAIKWEKEAYRSVVTCSFLAEGRTLNDFIKLNITKLL